VAGPSELGVLQRAIAELAALPIDGAVIGFVKGAEVDLDVMRAVLSAAPTLRVTFHRAFDALNDPEAAIDILRVVPQVDRILTAGGSGSWSDRCRRLERYALLAGPTLTILAGGGIAEVELSELASAGWIREVHVGRAAREASQPAGPVSVDGVRRLKDLARGRL
jgi:copper homeostasis protein